MPQRVRGGLCGIIRPTREFPSPLHTFRVMTDGGRFAGFRTIPQLSSVGESRLVVTPVFFDTAAIVAELREGVWTKGCAGVAFCFELPG